MKRSKSVRGYNAAKTAAETAMKPSLQSIPCPGGKTYAKKIVLAHLPLCTTSLVSPFLGGGAVELMAGAWGIPVQGSDMFQPLTCLCRMALERPVETAAM